MDPKAVYDEMKAFLEFSDADVENLVSMRPIFTQHGPGITDAFYETLGHFDTTAKLIEGRVDQLKSTHARWMGELFAGEYGYDYLESRMKIGKVHVRVGLPPYYVEVVMSVIRAGGMEALAQEIGDPTGIARMYHSLVKILDLDVLIINLAYADERLDRMSAITGMSRKLVENLIQKAR